MDEKLTFGRDVVCSECNSKVNVEQWRPEFCSLRDFFSRRGMLTRRWYTVFLCPECKKEFVYPLSALGRKWYWGEIIFSVGFIAACLILDVEPNYWGIFIGVLLASGIYELEIDKIIRKRVETASDNYNNGEKGRNANFTADSSNNI